MASFSKVDRFVAGNKKFVIGTLTLGTYATGGESIAPSVFGLKGVICVHGQVFRKTSDSSDAVLVKWKRGSTNVANGNMLAYRQKDPANAGGADIALPEVANSTDLSGYQATVTVIGY